MTDMKPTANTCFEASWEVCNKVGGIYTVVKSKILPMQQNYENYFLIGPFFPKKAYGIFEEKLPPEEWKQSLEKLKQEGIEVHYGSWIVPGSPNTLLLDFTKFAERKNEIKKNLYDWYQIDSLNTEWYDFDEPAVWAYAVGRVLEELRTVIQGKIVAHCHEWLAGAAVLYLRHNNVDIGTVFTTHATTLGRSLAMQERDIYLELENIKSDEEAKALGPSVWAKHLMEKKSAQTAHVFTTVSEITGIEAEHFLERKPDVLLFNGLDMSKFPTFEQASVRHKLYKSRIQQFLMYYFFPYYTFDLNQTLIYFLAGRYEFHDKGVDVFINALGKLNQKLKEANSPKTVVAFFWVPSNVKGIRPELLGSRTYFNDVKDTLDDAHEDILNSVLQVLIAKQEMNKETILGSDILQELKPKMMRMKREGIPPLSTHVLGDENDEIMNALHAAGLNNSEEDRVKAVFYPIYLSGADGLLDTSYYESMQGAHLGVFPSYYEPWGYTPLEAAALGVSSITTDLAGFGQYLCKECAPQKIPGIFVLPRLKKSEEETTETLTEMMWQFSQFSTKDRIDNKIMAQKIASSADWKLFIQRYIEAHNKAVE